MAYVFIRNYDIGTLFTFIDGFLKYKEAHSTYASVHRCPPEILNTGTLRYAYIYMTANEWPSEIKK